jgi:hypothetical protein
MTIPGQRDGRAGPARPEPDRARAFGGVAWHDTE